MVPSRVKPSRWNAAESNCSSRSWTEQKGEAPSTKEHGEENSGRNGSARKGRNQSLRGDGLVAVCSSLGGKRPVRAEPECRWFMGRRPSFAANENHVEREYHFPSQPVLARCAARVWLALKRVVAVVPLTTCIYESIAPPHVPDSQTRRAARCASGGSGRAQKKPDRV